MVNAWKETSRGILRQNEKLYMVCAPKLDLAKANFTINVQTLSGDFQHARGKIHM